ncbi:MAG: hypothetical protein U0353_13915 [Sandaracinus sp.]
MIAIGEPAPEGEADRHAHHEVQDHLAEEHGAHLAPREAEHAHGREIARAHAQRDAHVVVDDLDRDHDQRRPVKAVMTIIERPASLVERIDDRATPHELRDARRARERRA